MLIDWSNTSKHHINLSDRSHQRFRSIMLTLHLLCFVYFSELTWKFHLHWDLCMRTDHFAKSIVCQLIHERTSMQPYAVYTNNLIAKKPSSQLTSLTDSCRICKPFTVAWFYADVACLRWLVPLGDGGWWWRLVGWIGRVGGVEVQPQNTYSWVKLPSLCPPLTLTQSPHYWTARETH